MAWLNREILGNPLSAYFALLGIAFAAFLGYFVLLQLLESRWLKKLQEEQKEFYESLVILTRTPLRLLLLTLVFWAGLQLFEISPTLRDFLEKVLIALVATTALYFTLRLIDTGVAYFKAQVEKTESKLDDTLLYVARLTLRTFTVVVIVLIALENLGIEIAGLLAGLGIAGLAVALAAQQTLANIFGAITIFLDRPFRIGDAVSLEGFTGKIEAIGLRSTRLRTFDGTLVTLPNSVVANAKIDNWDARPTRRTNFTIGVTYDTSYEKLKRAVEILREVMANHPGTAQYRAYFNSYGDYSLNILVNHWCKYLDYEQYLQCIEEILFEIKKRFEEEGIEFAFPSQTLYVVPEKPFEILASDAIQEDRLRELASRSTVEPEPKTET
jgi:MscS family membrane protein